MGGPRDSARFHLPARLRSSVLGSGPWSSSSALALAFVSSLHSPVLMAGNSIVGNRRLANFGICAARGKLCRCKGPGLGS